MRLLPDTDTLNYLLKGFQKVRGRFDAVLAVRESAVLITSNVSHFEGLGIPMEDWMA